MKKRSIILVIVGVLVLVFLPCVIWQGVKAFIVESYTITATSMTPTLEENDRFLVNKLAYRGEAQPERGDIVVFDDLTREYPQLVSRVIAIGGDMIDLRDGNVFLNGELLDEPYVEGRPTLPIGSTEFPLEVPAGFAFVMGDNRTNSTDSRIYGAVPVDSVNGRVIW
jgi:signal peptidase I